MPDSIPNSFQPALQRAPAALNLLFVVLIGLMAARLFWLLWPTPETALMAPPARSRSTVDGDGDAVDIDRIAAVNLFGEHEVAEAKKTEVINAPETHLNLTLTGIVSSNTGEGSRALIKGEKNEQESYAVGDAISPNVKLHAIYSNRVILDRSGRFETLTLEREKNPEGVKRVQRQQVNEDLAEDLSEARTQILQDPSKASRYLRLQPEKRNGKLVGYRIYPGRDRKLFQKAGLRPGELVTKVNGVELNDPGQALQMLGSLAQASSITVTLQRGGSQRTMTVSFQ